MAETFGLTDKGGTEWSIPSRLSVCKYTSGSEGTLASIKVYIKYVNATDMQCAIYNADFSSLLANGITEEKAVELGQDGWMTFNFTTPPAVAATTAYYLAFWHESSNVKIYYESGVSTQAAEDTTASYNSWPEPMINSAFRALAYSVHAVYSEAPPPAKKAIVQAALISIPPLIVLPTLSQIIKVTGG